MHILMIGCGRMGSALAESWLKANPDTLRITVITATNTPEITKYKNVHHGLIADLDSQLKDAAEFDLIVLAIKPQKFADVLPQIAQYFSAHKPPALSVAAGIRLSDIEACLGADYPVIRSMPNTPCLVNAGITALFANSKVGEAAKSSITHLMQAAGPVVWLEREDDMNSVTAISGSGPAYVFHFIECLTQAGINLGLTEDLATQLARQTVIGAAHLAAHNTEDTATRLRENVTSPGGTTEAGLTVLMDLQNGLQPLINRTTQAAKTRGQELSGSS